MTTATLATVIKGGKIAIGDVLQFDAWPHKWRVVAIAKNRVTMETAS